MYTPVCIKWFRPIAYSSFRLSSAGIDTLLMAYCFSILSSIATFLERTSWYMFDGIFGVLPVFA